jgi:ketosteroid isomerase-like protein
MGAETSGPVGRVYEAWSAGDTATIDSLMSPDFVMHVAGGHPLSGVYRGKQDVWGYLDKVARISGGKGNFEVRAIAEDGGEHTLVLLTGTIRDFVRPVIHLWRTRDGRFLEFWDASLDQGAEDEFWTSTA